MHGRSIRRRTQRRMLAVGCIRTAADSAPRCPSPAHKTRAGAAKTIGEARVLLAGPSCHRDLAVIYLARCGDLDQPILDAHEQALLVWYFPRKRADVLAKGRLAPAFR